MSIPDDAVTMGGWVIVSSGSITARVGRRRGWLIPVFTRRLSTSSTHTVVLSAPVPAVVGTATNGFRALTGALPSPIGALTYSISPPGLFISRLIALAVSMLDPPPTAT